MTKYYNEKIECMQRDKIKKLQLELFNIQLQRAQNAKAYKNEMPEKIADLSEIRKLPFTTKDDLRQNFPYGFLSVDKEKIARFNASSGTSGIMSLIALSAKDENTATETAKRLFIAMGIEKNDVIQNMLSLELPDELLENTEAFRKLEYNLIKTLKSYITINPKLNFVPLGTLPEVQGKAKRVIKE